MKILGSFCITYIPMKEEVGTVGSRAGACRVEKVCLASREALKFMISKIGNSYVYKMDHTHISILICDYAKHCSPMSSIRASYLRGH
jgi:hypothetical protein